MTVCLLPGCSRLPVPLGICYAWPKGARRAQELACAPVILRDSRLGNMPSCPGAHTSCTGGRNVFAAQRAERAGAALRAGDALHAAQSLTQAAPVGAHHSRPSALSAPELPCAPAMLFMLLRASRSLHRWAPIIRGPAR